MRLARKLMLLAITALAAMAVAAPSASATEAITVTNAAGVSCSSQAGGDCNVHVVQEAGEQIELGVVIFGFYSHNSNCDNEYTLNVNGNGVGSISDFDISNCSSTTEPCNSTPWPGSGEEIAAGITQLEVDVCITTPIGSCSGDFVVNISRDADTADPNDLEGRSANRAPIGGSICRVTGHWQMEGTDIRIVHS